MEIDLSPDPISEDDDADLAAAEADTIWWGSTLEGLYAGEGLERIIQSQGWKTRSQQPFGIPSPKQKHPDRCHNCRTGFGWKRGRRNMRQINYTFDNNTPLYETMSLAGMKQRGWPLAERRSNILDALHDSIQTVVKRYKEPEIYSPNLLRPSLNYLICE